MPLQVKAFVFAIALVGVLAVMLAFRAVLMRLRLVAAPSRLELAARGPVGALVAIGAGCILYGRLVEPWWPAVERVRIESARWPAASAPLRLVHLSDLHCEREPRLEERLPGLVAAERPDVIVFTGDSLNEPAGLPVLRRLLTRLAAVAPVYVVKGNWDVWYWSDLDLFGGTGVHELDAGAQTLTVRGARDLLSVALQYGNAFLCGFQAAALAFGVVALTVAATLAVAALGLSLLFDRHVARIAVAEAADTVALVHDLSAAAALTIPVALFIVTFWALALRPRAGTLVNTITPIAAILIAASTFLPGSAVITAVICGFVVAALVARPILTE